MAETQFNCIRLAGPEPRIRFDAGPFSEQQLISFVEGLQQFIKAWCQANSLPLNDPNEKKIVLAN